MARRPRQHVNPLSARYLVERAVPIRPPNHLGAAPPTDVELGCADGEFCFQLARLAPDRFVVGLDIREKMVARAHRRAQAEGLSNLRFGYANLQVDLHRVFPAASVDRFHLLFPDPWFKARHGKRRVVGPYLLAAVARQLRPGGLLHVATDVFDVALGAMAELESPAAEDLGFRSAAPRGPWTFVRDNPFPAVSRREATTRARGQRVWRLLYRRIGAVTAGAAPQDDEPDPRW